MDMSLKSTQDFLNLLIAFGTDYGIKIIGAIVILIAGRIAAGVGRKVIQQILEKAKGDPSVVSFFESLSYIATLTFAVLAALAKFGIQTASFVAVLGAATFAVGFALQGSLANFAAGELILLFRPFRVGDFIEAAGGMGTVARSTSSPRFWPRWTTCRSSCPTASCTGISSRTTPPTPPAGRISWSASVTGHLSARRPISCKSSYNQP
jgi:hypothetical protein